MAVRALHYPYAAVTAWEGSVKWRLHCVRGPKRECLREVG